MIRRAGEHGLLVETGALEVSHRLDAALRAERPPRVREVVPGPETVLVVAPGADVGRLRTLLETLLARCRDLPPNERTESDVPFGERTESRASAGERSGGRVLAESDIPTGSGGSPDEEAGSRGRVGSDIPTGSGGSSGERVAGGGSGAPDGAGLVSDVVRIRVVYDGADLGSVAEAAGITVEEVVARHTGRELVVGWLGFAPGFAYLTGLDPVLHVPRLATPRTSVPAGSVAIAGPYSAVYPTASPGGWRLLGRTDATVWDVSAEPPTPFRPGIRVRFEAA